MLVFIDSIMRANAHSFGHPNTRVTESERLGSLVGDDIDAKILARVELAGVGQSFIADLVQSIRRVGNDFSQENLFVGVDGVDDEGK